MVYPDHKNSTAFARDVVESSKPSEDSAYFESKETTKDHGGSVVNSQAALQNLCYCMLKLRYINSMINSSPGYA